MLGLVFVPTLLVFVTSVLTRDETNFVQATFTGQNYARLMSSDYFAVFVNSCFLGLVTTGLCLLIAYPFAYYLSRLPARLKPVLLFLLIVPFWTNSLIRIYAMKLLLAANGLVNKFLLSAGLISQPLEMLYTDGAVVAGLVFLLFPFMVLPLYAVFEQLPRSYWEAAADLGARSFTFWRRVVLPLSLPGIIAGTLLVFIPAMGMFYVADLLGGAKQVLAGNLIKEQFLDARDWPFGSAAAVLLTLALSGLLWAYFASVKRLPSRGDRVVV